jgi:hypothetical protein
LDGGCVNRRLAAIGDGPTVILHVACKMRPAIGHCAMSGILRTSVSLYTVVVQVEVLFSPKLISTWLTNQAIGRFERSYSVAQKLQEVGKPDIIFDP